MRVLGVIVLFLFSTLGSGCAFSPAPVQGWLFSDVRYPMPELDAVNQANSSKRGESSATSILGLVATGDAGIQTAAANGGIKKIHHVDYHSTNFLGIFATFKTIVYGE